MAKRKIKLTNREIVFSKLPLWGKEIIRSLEKIDERLMKINFLLIAILIIIYDYGFKEFKFIDLKLPVNKWFWKRISRKLMNAGIIEKKSRYVYKVNRERLNEVIRFLRSISEVSRMTYGG